MLRPRMDKTRLHRFGTPLAIYVVCALVYVVTLDTRRESPS